MTGYLARLKTLLAEKPPPEELTELTKGASVSFVRNQVSLVSEGEGAFVSSVSNRSRNVSGDDDTETFDADAIEERAALASDRVPACYLEAWARLNHRNPTRVSEAQWRIAIDDGGRFLDQWGREAAQFGWTPAELFEAGAGLILASLW
jgi:hypothetical protein